MATARAGVGGRAVELLRLAGPVGHSRDAAAATRYRVEPYVAAGDVYQLPDGTARGGWTWYTCAAGWMYRAWLEEVLGIRVRGDRLCVAPVIPADWPGFGVRLRRGSALYEVVVENPDGVQSGVALVQLDGRSMEGGVVPYLDDGAKQVVRVRMGAILAADGEPGR